MKTESRKRVGIVVLWSAFTLCYIPAGSAEDDLLGRGEPSLRETETSLKNPVKLTISIASQVGEFERFLEGGHAKKTSNETAVAPDVQPELFGIGISIFSGTQGPQIRRIMPNSPAAKANLHEGLVISKIDDTPTLGKTPEECAHMIRGAAGTSVRLEVMDYRDHSTRQVTIIREKLPSDLTPAQRR